MVDPKELVGTWNGFSRDNGKSASLKVKSVNGRAAAASCTGHHVAHRANCVAQNATVMFGEPQVTGDNFRAFKADFYLYV